MRRASKLSAAIRRQRKGQGTKRVKLEGMPRGYDSSNRPRITTKQSGARGDYDTARWKRESKEFLGRNPFCACGCGREANIVDHIVPVRPVGDPRFFDQANWQGLCADCHRQKSADDRARAAGRKPQPIRRRAAIDPSTGMPLAGQAH